MPGSVTSSWPSVTDRAVSGWAAMAVVICRRVGRRARARAGRAANRTGRLAAGLAGSHHLDADRAGGVAIEVALDPQERPVQAEREGRGGDADDERPERHRGPRRMRETGRRPEPAGKSDRQGGVRAVAGGRRRAPRVGAPPRVIAATALSRPARAAGTIAASSEVARATARTITTTGTERLNAAGSPNDLRRVVRRSAGWRSSRATTPTTDADRRRHEDLAERGWCVTWPGV